MPLNTGEFKKAFYLMDHNMRTKSLNSVSHGKSIVSLILSKTVGFVRQH